MTLQYVPGSRVTPTTCSLRIHRFKKAIKWIRWMDVWLKCLRKKRRTRWLGLEMGSHTPERRTKLRRDRESRRLTCYGASSSEGEGFLVTTNTRISLRIDSTQAYSFFLLHLHCLNHSQRTDWRWQGNGNQERRIANSGLLFCEASRTFYWWTGPFRSGTWEQREERLTQALPLVVLFENPKEDPYPNLTWKIPQFSSFLHSSSTTRQSRS